GAGHPFRVDPRGPRPARRSREVARDRAHRRPPRGGRLRPPRDAPLLLGGARGAARTPRRGRRRRRGRRASPPRGGGAGDPQAARSVRGAARVRPQLAQLRGAHHRRPARRLSKKLVIYLVAEPETPELARAAVEGGADIVELGFPFSDPLAEGPVIRRASE